VDAAVAKILSTYQAESLIRVEVREIASSSYKQATPGRPSPQTKYVRRDRLCFLTSAEVDRAAVAEAEREDGVFPLLTNDRQLGADEVLRAYKRQPLIEKRFSQFKTDFAVAPVYLKNVARVQGLLAVYFLVLLVQTLLERELRLALKRTGQEFLPLYPESRPCRRPTTRRVLDAFEPVQRHVIEVPSGDEQTMITQLTEVQRQILELLQLSHEEYGR
jgi:transposase